MLTLTAVMLTTAAHGALFGFVSKWHVAIGGIADGSLQHLSVFVGGLHPLAAALIMEVLLGIGGVTFALVSYHRPGKVRWLFIWTFWALFATVIFDAIVVVRSILNGEASGQYGLLGMIIIAVGVLEIAIPANLVTFVPSLVVLHVLIVRLRRSIGAATPRTPTQTVAAWLLASTAAHLALRVALGEALYLAIGGSLALAALLAWDASEAWRRHGLTSRCKLQLAVGVLLVVASCGLQTRRALTPPASSQVGPSSNEPPACEDNTYAFQHQGKLGAYSKAVLRLEGVACARTIYRCRETHTDGSAAPSTCQYDVFLVLADGTAQGGEAKRGRAGRETAAGAIPIALGRAAEAAVRLASASCKGHREKGQRPPLVRVLMARCRPMIVTARVKLGRYGTLEQARSMVKHRVRVAFSAAGCQIFDGDEHGVEKLLDGLPSELIGVERITYSMTVGQTPGAALKPGAEPRFEVGDLPVLEVQVLEDKEAGKGAKEGAE